MYNNLLTKVTIGSNVITTPEFYVEFELSHKNGSDYPTAKIKIWNLIDSTINTIDENDGVLLEIGYGSYSKIFEGYIDEMETVNKNGDVITTIECKSLSVEDKEKIIGKVSMSGQFKAYDVIQFLIDSTSYVLGSLEMRQNRTFLNGYTQQSSHLEEIRRIVKDNNGKMSIMGNIIYIYPDDQTIDTVGLNLTYDSGLLDKPRVGKGTSDLIVKCLPHPLISVNGSYVVIDGATYVITEIKMTHNEATLKVKGVK
jgi:hypothetical protein